MRSHGVVRGGIIRLLVIISPVIRRVAIEAVWTRAVDARIDPKCERRDYLKCMEGRWRRDGAITVLLAHSGIGPCELADKLRDAPAPYTVVYDDTQIDTYSRGEPELVRVRAPRRVERRRRGLAAPGVAAPREPRADDLGPEVVHERRPRQRVALAQAPQAPAVRRPNKGDQQLVPAPLRHGVDAKAEHREQRD